MASQKDKKIVYRSNSKRIISVILVLIIIGASFPIEVSADYRPQVIVVYEGGLASKAVTKGAYFYVQGGIPNKTGYIFNGWRSSYDGQIYQNGDYIQAPYVDVLTFTPVWEAKTYNVDYNANGGTDAPERQIKTYGRDLRLSAATPTHYGYAFQGWSRSATSATVSYLPNQYYTNNASITLTAATSQTA